MESIYVIILLHPSITNQIWFRKNWTKNYPVFKEYMPRHFNGICDHIWFCTHRAYSWYAMSWRRKEFSVNGICQGKVFSYWRIWISRSEHLGNSVTVQGQRIINSCITIAVYDIWIKEKWQHCINSKVIIYHCGYICIFLLFSCTMKETLIEIVGNINWMRQY